MKIVNDEGRLETLPIDEIADCFFETLVNPTEWEEELCDFIDSQISGTDEEIATLRDYVEDCIIYSQGEALNHFASRKDILEWIKDNISDEVEYLTPEEILNAILENSNK